MAELTIETLRQNGVSYHRWLRDEALRAFGVDLWKEQHTEPDAVAARTITFQEFAEIRGPLADLLRERLTVMVSDPKAFQREGWNTGPLCPKCGESQMNGACQYLIRYVAEGLAYWCPTCRYYTAAIGPDGLFNGWTDEAKK